MEMLRRATLRAVSTIGIPSLLALLLGVPAMTAFVFQVWSALSQSQRAIVVACLALIVIAIAIFVYGQTKKELMVIPKIISKMSERANNITDKLEYSADSEELKQFTSLIGLVGHNFEKIPDYETFKVRAPELLKEVQASGNRIKHDPKQSVRVMRFLYEGHIRKALETDKQYQALKKLLMSKRSIIPTPELSQQIINYTKMAVARCSFAMVLNPKDPRILEIVPVADQLDAKIDMDEIDDK